MTEEIFPETYTIYTEFLKLWRILSQPKYVKNVLNVVKILLL